tara:strand:+ start:313 stop:1368 length:1056 start_codon:yes stop_codon:yes gene_type:complete
MTLPSSGQLSLGDIANEFGFTDGSSTKLGDYRTTNGQGNFPVSFGALQFNSIDAQSGGSVPTGSAQIKISDFRSTRLQQVVNFYGSGKGGNRLVAKDRYNANGSGDVNVVGNYKTRPNNSSGTKVHIHVNQTIGSEKTRIEHCALRTGSWDSSTTLQVDVGGSGRIGGAGGDGGKGSTNSGSGFAGGTGTSGLGVQYNPTQVNVASGGVITAGFGGGGGGGGAYDYDKNSSRTASGGGGGGGAGIPAGSGGAEGSGGTEGGPGNAGSVSEGGSGGNGGNNAGEAVAGGGGTGGEGSDSADAGGTGQGGEGSTSSGGPAGLPGAAIRRNSGFTVNVTNNGSINGVQNATTVL